MLIPRLGQKKTTRDLIEYVVDCFMYHLYLFVTLFSPVIIQAARLSFFAFSKSLAKLENNLYLHQYLFLDHHINKTHIFYCITYNCLILVYILCKFDEIFRCENPGLKTKGSPYRAYGTVLFTSIQPASAAEFIFHRTQNYISTSLG